MPKAVDMAKTFYTPSSGEFVADFIARHRRLAPWKKQSVAVILFSPERDKIALCFPHKVLKREGEDRIRVPLQGRLTGREVNPVDEARRILQQKAGVLVRADEIQYLGFGMTRSFRAGETELPYNKLLHVVYCSLAHERRLPPETAYAAHLEWFHLDAIPSIAASSMDERKAWLFFSALKQVAAKHTPFAPRLRKAIGS